MAPGALGWVATLALVMRLWGEAPAALVLLPPDGLIRALPDGVAVVSAGPVSVTLRGGVDRLPASVRPWRIVPRTEDGAANPDMRGTMRNRDFKVAAHPHRKAGQPVIRRHCRKHREMWRGIFGFGGDAHQAVDRQVHCPAIGQESGQIARQNPGLLRFVAGVHLHEQVRAGPARLGQRGQLLRQ